MKPDIISLSDYVCDRTRRRLDGLTDDEYRWEPVPGCWSIRSDDGGAFHLDGGGAPGGPFTTIAWRLWHLIGCYGAMRNAEWLGVGRPVPGFEHDDPVPAGAAGALDALGRAAEAWHALLEALPEDAWKAPLGAVAGPYGEQLKAGFVLHQLDEQIHHGAELGVLRDLYRAQAR